MGSVEKLHGEVFQAEVSPTAFVPPQTDNTNVCAGVWINDASNSHTIDVFRQDGQNISIEVTSVKLTGDGKNVSAIDITKIEDIVLVDGCGAKKYTDSWENEGIIYLAFTGDRLQVNYEVLSRGLGRWGIDTGAGTYHKEAKEYG